jgi:hypothetical protein
MATEAARQHKRSVLEIVRGEMLSRALLVVVASVALVFASALMKSVSVQGGWIDSVASWLLGK